jgi:hypothetical protein
LLSEQPAAPDNSPLTALDSFAGRSLIRGGRSARGYDLGGKILFEVPLGEFTLAQAMGARLTAGQPPFLALVGSTDRHAGRWRLLIVDPSRRAVYDEILDEYPRILTAERADGSHALFIGGRRGLRVLQSR